MAVPWPIVRTLARLVLGGVLIAAGASKVTDPDGSVRAVRAYRLLPDGLERVIGYGLPPLEIVVGLLLFVGLATRLSAVIAGVLMLAFAAGVASAWARGLQIDCGCFGGGGEVSGDQSGTYALEIARDVGLLVLAAALVRWPDSRWSLDAVLLGPAVPAEPHDQEIRT